MNGKGSFQWPDGTTFIGHFENDRKRGDGTVIFPTNITWVDMPKIKEELLAEEEKIIHNYSFIT